MRSGYTVDIFLKLINLPRLEFSVKKYTCIFLVLANSATIFPIILEKDSVVIEYKKLFMHEYAHWGAGSPYSIKITNNSSKLCSIAASFVKNMVYQQSEVAEKAHSKNKSQLSKNASYACISIATSYCLYKYVLFNEGVLSKIEQDSVNWLGYSGFACFALACFFSLQTLGSAVNILLDESAAKIDRDILKLPIIITPGNSLDKIIWLQKGDQVPDIDLDALQLQPE